MPTTRQIPNVSASAKNVMRNPKYAQHVVDTVNTLQTAEVRVGSGPSSLSVSPNKALIHISIEEIVKQLRDGGHIS